MAERTVKLQLSLSTQGLVTGLRNAKAAVSDFTDGVEKGIRNNTSAVDGLSNTMGLIGGAAVGAVTLAVRSFAAFDKQMSAVAATGDDARGSLEALREAAIQAGAETSFSATEAAQAIEELAKAGLSSADILGGALDGALSLAASDNLDLADAASFAATAIQQFNLRGSDAEHVADLLAAGAGKAMGGVTDMGAALNQAGLIAAGMGVSIEETTGALAAFAQQGLLGSDAGTSLKTMLSALSNPSKESAALMKELGISAYDAAGNFVGLQALAGQLDDKLKGLTQAQRDQALAQIFGNDAVRAARVLYEEGAAGIADWTAAVDDSGFAAEQAAIKMNNLAGDWEAFTGSLETAMIGAGEGANGPLRALVQSATDAVNAFSSLPAAVQQGTLLIAGGGGLALLGVAAMGKLTVATLENIGAMRDLGLISEATAGRMDRIARAGVKIGGLAVGVLAAAAAMDELTNNSYRAVIGVEETESALRGLNFANTDTLFRDVSSSINSMDDAFELLFGNSPDAKMERLGHGINMAFGGQASDQLKTAEEQFENIGVALSQLVSEGNAELAAEQFDKIAEAAMAQGATLEQVQALMPAYQEALAGVANESAETSGAQDEMAGSTDDAAAALQAQTDALEENWKAQVTAANGVLSLRDAQRAEEAAVDAATKALEENGATLDITTEKGRTNQAALDDIATAGWRVVDSMRENGATAGELQGTMQATRDRFLAAAGAFGMGADEANRLADQMGLIPTQVSSRVEVNTESASRELENFVARWNGQTISVSRAAVTYSASGGMPGGGTGTTPPKFEHGGYTGNYSRTAEAGVVHGQEFVVNADATARHRALLEKINAGMPGYANGGYVGASMSGPVQATVGDVVARLDPRDARALIDGILAGARDVAATMTASEIRHNSAVSQARGVVR